MVGTGVEDYFDSSYYFGADAGILDLMFRTELSGLTFFQRRVDGSGCPPTGSMPTTRAIKLPRPAPRVLRSTAAAALADSLILGRWCDRLGPQAGL